LGNIDESKLDYQINLTGSLQCYGAINLAVLLGDTGRCEGGVLKLNINSAVNGLESSNSFYFLYQASFVSFRQRREKLRHLDLCMGSKEAAAAGKQARDQKEHQWAESAQSDTGGVG
jgi:hypothetical protein